MSLSKSQRLHHLTQNRVSVSCSNLTSQRLELLQVNDDDLIKMAVREDEGVRDIELCSFWFG